MTSVSRSPEHHEKLPRYVQRERTRHGKHVYYVRKGAGPRIRIDADLGTAEFREAYAAALHGSVRRERPKPLTPEANNRRRISLQLQSAIIGAKSRAVANGREFAIDLDWALSEVVANDFRCPLTGIPYFARPTEVRSSRDPYAPSLDRIDSSRGYTKENTRVVIFAINLMMLDWGPEVFERVTNGYRATKGRRR